MNKAKLFAVVSAVASLFAVTVATSACFWYFYQPAEPKNLKDM